MFLDWLWKKEQPSYVYYKKRVPAYYGLCGFKYDVITVEVTKGGEIIDAIMRCTPSLGENQYTEFYRSTYLIKSFTFDNYGNVTGFIADDS